LDVGLLKRRDTAWQALPLGVTNRPMAVDDLTLQCRDIIPVQR